MTAQKKIGLAIISLLSILFYCYTNNPVHFAELHLKLSFLNFPIFIGEIALCVCVLLFAVKLSREPLKWQRGHTIVLLFFIFIFIKAALGYWHWGALALRNAALFYYSLFAIIVFNSFDADTYKDKKVRYALLALLFVVFLFRLIGIDYYFEYVIFGICLLLGVKNPIGKYIVMLIYIILAITSFITGSRGVLISLSASLVLLFGIYIFAFLKFKLKYKIGALLILSCLAVGTISIRGDKNAIKSLTSFDKYIKSYQEMAMIAEANRDIELPRVSVKVYHTNEIPEQQHTHKIKIPLSMKEIEKIERNILKRVEQVNSLEVAFQKAEKKEQEQAQLLHEQLTYIKRYLKILQHKVDEHVQLLKDPTSKTEQQLESLQRRLQELQARIGQLQFKIEVKKGKYRSLHTAQGNVMWRIFVWKDMIVDLVSSKSFFGLDFGYPFRSRSLEIISIVTGGDWSRGHWVGWIEPHNSYIHILYRSGIIGVLYILALWGMALKMMQKFIRGRNIKGILLVTAVFYWLFMANFAVILELPYFAIPFWCLFGFVCKYAHDYKLESSNG